MRLSGNSVSLQSETFLNHSWNSAILVWEFIISKLTFSWYKRNQLRLMHGFVLFLGGTEDFIFRISV